ncbi:MAG: hypothetical protein MJE68_14350, partial [Proteobacteria bacterium]|nr:hypothetical protein [Pseudomonadota bacterium]
PELFFQWFGAVSPEMSWLFAIEAAVVATFCIVSEMHCCGVELGIELQLHVLSPFPLFMICVWGLVISFSGDGTYFHVRRMDGDGLVLS